MSGIAGKTGWRTGRGKPRVLALAVLALFLQASLPYFLTNCPLYAIDTPIAKQDSASAAMMPDCPMMAGMQMASSTPDSHPAKKHAAPSCPLCEVSSAFHGFVAAGLIDLPPPQRVVHVASVATQQAFISRPVAAGFSARAPPV